MLRASVIIPTWNRARVLDACLRHLARQELPAEEYEVIVVDDGSTDNTAHIISTGERPRNLVYERIDAGDERSCVSRPRNRGLELARSEIAIFLDCDVMAGAQLIAKHVEAHESSPDPQEVIGHIYGYPMDPRDRVPERMQPPDLEHIVDSLPRLLEQHPERWEDGRRWAYEMWPGLRGCPEPWTLAWGANISAPRAIAVELGGFDTDFTGWGWEDTEFSYRLHRHGVALGHQPAAWGVHYPHPISIAKDQERKNLLRMLDKHRDPIIELTCMTELSRAEHQKLGGIESGLWEMFNELRRMLHAGQQGRLPAVGVVDRVRARLQDDSNVHWFGDAPSGWPGNWRPAMHHQPRRFVAVGGQFSGPVGFMGVATPYADRSLTGAVFVDYWAELGSAALDLLCAEATRVASDVILLSTTALVHRDCPVGPRARYRTGATATMISELPGWHLRS